MIEAAFRCTWIIGTVQGFTDAHDFTSSIPNVGRLVSTNDLLGKGSYGAVYSGTLNDGTTVAVKQYSHLNKTLIHTNVCDWSSCMKEIAMLSQLQGSGIVGELHGVGWFCGSWIILMQQHSLGSIAWAKHELWSVERTKQIVVDLFGAIRSVHKLTGQVHGDVKPCNVMLDIVDNDKVKVWIIDFGLSESVGTIEKGHQYLQTMFWRSPELLEGKSCDLIEADLWATAITAFDIMAGKHVMGDFGANAATTDAKMMAILQANVLGRTSVPDEWNIHQELLKLANDLFRLYIVR
jgi:serine/threonine protein kinase